MEENSLQYNSKMVNELNKIYQEWDQKLRDSPGIGAIVYKILRPEIPHLLNDLDNDPELQKKVRDFIASFTTAIEEEIEDVSQPGKG